MASLKTIGQAAYEKWASLIPGGAPPIWPGWDKLPKSAQEGWEEVALAAVNQHIDDGLKEDMAKVDRNINMSMK